MALPTASGDNNFTTSPVIQFHPASQLPIKLTGSLNFSTWKAQFSMLMYGHDLYGHLDGTKPSPARTIGESDNPNPAFSLWFRQDQLIQNTLMASVDLTIAPTVGNASSAQHAWEALHSTYANKSHSRLFSLRDHLGRISKDTQSISTYLSRALAIIDELAAANAPLADGDLVVHILRGLGSEYHEISATIRARDVTISYKDLCDKLMDYEVFLAHEESQKLMAPITAAVAQRARSLNNTTPRNNRRNSQPWHNN
nr:unnamed protein product [Gossypium raimondii]